MPDLIIFFAILALQFVLSHKFERLRQEERKALLHV